MKKFTEGELEVMGVLWEHEELSPQEIQEEFPRPIKNATLRSMLRVLLEKGHVTRRKVSHSYRYKAVTPAQGAFEKMVRRMADLFCEGSPATLITRMIEAEELSDEDIRELRRITRMKAEASSRKGRKK